MLFRSTDNASHFDLGIIPADVPDIGGIAVAVWHGSDGNLWLAYNPTPVDDATFWETRPTPVAENAGSHVVMKIDPEGGVHLAYLDSELAYLRYTYLPTFNANDSEKKTVLVDARFSSGQYNGIAIRNFGTEAAPDYRPVISTFSTTYAGTRAAIRVAWPVTNLAGLTDGADMDTSEYSGSWEVMLVPAVTTPQSAKSFIEITNPTGANQLVVGYNGTYLEEATYLGTP